MIPDLDYTYQVDRARFDQILLEHAKETGVEVVQPAQIQSIERKAGEAGWSIRYINNEAETSQETKFLVDASGRSCTLARHLRLSKKSIQLPNRIAIFSHFTGVPRTSGEFAGDIRIVRIPSGWFWIIPVSETTTSVGLVFCATDKPAGTRAEQFFFEKVAGNALMQKLLQEAKHQMPFKTDSDFSYIHSTFAGDDFLLIGDAAAFLDPVFSSGVYLSLEAANLSADLLQTALRRKSPLTARQQRLYDRRYLTRLKTMESLIRVFYDEEQFPVFMNPRSTLKLAEAVNSVVAGYSILNFPLRWRYELFLWICRLNKSRQIVPPIQL